MGIEQIPVRAGAELRPPRHTKAQRPLRLEGRGRVNPNSAAHLVPLEAPDAANKLILDFVRDLPPL
jgi:hypothetical protein